MQHVALTIHIGDSSISPRRFKTTYWFTYPDGFTYSEPFYNHFFWGIRIGRCNQGVHYAVFKDAQSGHVLKELSGSDIPTQWKGYCGPQYEKMFAMGVRFRLDYNEGSPVYRTLPCGLRTKYVRRANRRLLVALSSRFWADYDSYWRPRFEDECGHIFQQDAPYWLSQRDKKMRQCIDIVPIGVGVERRLLLI